MFQSTGHHGSGGGSRRRQHQTTTAEIAEQYPASNADIVPDETPAQQSFKEQSQNIAIGRAMSGNALTQGVGIRGQMVVEKQYEEQKVKYIGSYEAGQAEKARQEKIISSRYGAGEYTSQEQIDEDVRRANLKIQSASIAGGQVASSYLKEERRKKAEELASRMPKEERITEFKWYEVFTAPTSKVSKASIQASEFYQMKASEMGGREIQPFASPLEIASYNKKDLKTSGYSLLAGATKTLARTGRPDVGVVESPYGFAGGVALGALSAFPATRPVASGVGIALGVGAGVSVRLSDKPLTTTGNIASEAVPFSYGFGATKGAISGAKYLFSPRIKETFIPPSASWTPESLRKGGLIRKVDVWSGVILKAEKYPSRASEFFGNMKTPTITGKKGQISIGRGGDFGDFQGTRPREPDIFESAKPKEDIFGKTEVKTEPRPITSPQTIIKAEPFIGGRVTPRIGTGGIFGSGGRPSSGSLPRYTPKYQPSPISAPNFIGITDTPPVEVVDSIPITTPIYTTHVPSMSFTDTPVIGRRIEPINKEPSIKFPGFMPSIPIRGGGFSLKGRSFRGKRVKKGYVPGISNIDPAFRVIKRGRAPKGGVSAFGARPIYI